MEEDNDEIDNNDLMQVDPSNSVLNTCHETLKRILNAQQQPTTTTLNNQAGYVQNSFIGWDAGQGIVERAEVKARHITKIYQVSNEIKGSQSTKSKV